MQGGDLFVRKKPTNKKIPVESSKRKEEKKYYKDHCRDLEMEIREQNDGKIFCFFTDKEINETISWHHLRGRTGKFYIDKEWLVPALNDYHLEFHFATIDYLLAQPWYSEFMEKLKKKDYHSYCKQKRKEEKSKELFD